MCMQMTPASTAAQMAGIAGSNVNPEMSLTMWAPASRAARATADFVVSIEIRTGDCFAICAMTGMTRRSSSSVATGGAPGRVDSPPTSMICARQRPAGAPVPPPRLHSRKSPPSEKLSGVVLTIPISQGRGAGQPPTADAPGTGRPGSLGNDIARHRYCSAMSGVKQEVTYS